MDGKITVLDTTDVFGLTTFVVDGKLFIKASAGVDGGVAIHEVGNYEGSLKPSANVAAFESKIKDCDEQIIKSFDEQMEKVKGKYRR